MNRRDMKNCVIYVRLLLDTLPVKGTDGETDLKRPMIYEYANFVDGTFFVNIYLRRVEGNFAY